MKKISILSIAVLAISFASCTKDRTCTCTDATGSEVRTIKKATQAQAEADCQTVTHTESGSTSTENCTLSN